MVEKMYAFSVDIRNGRTRNLVIGENLTKMIKNRINILNKTILNSNNVQNNIKQLQNHVKEAFTCFYLAVLT